VGNELASDDAHAVPDLLQAHVRLSQVVLVRPGEREFRVGILDAPDIGVLLEAVEGTPQGRPRTVGPPLRLGSSVRVISRIRTGQGVLTLGRGNDVSPVTLQRGNSPPLKWVAVCAR
jgi:hypothetical protein